MYVRTDLDTSIKLFVVPHESTDFLICFLAFKKKESVFIISTAGQAKILNLVFKFCNVNISKKSIFQIFQTNSKTRDQDGSSNI